MILPSLILIAGILLLFWSAILDEIGYDNVHIIAFIGIFVSFIGGSTDYNKVTEEEICKQYHQDYDAITPGKKKKKVKTPLEERVKAILNCKL